VTVAARRLDLLEGAKATIEAEGGSAAVAHLDVVDEASIDALFSGRSAFDILVNNAGVSQPARAAEVSSSDWDAVMATNLRGPFLLARGACAALRKAGRPGTIVNVASILGLRTAGDVAAYATSKAGLIHLTRILALEWARHSIRVNSLCPGYIETDLNRSFLRSPAGEALVRRIPARRFGRPDDLDGAMLLLCSDAGRYITGTTLVVDGGHLVSSL
jgi:NAD(P)-dependent dehydrogenase (short-subunit alcohol dehydrogenase family)